MSFEPSTLESMCELIIDCPHSTPKWTKSGVVVLRNQNIRNGQLDLSSPSFTDEDGYNSRTKRAAPQAGDIVFTREAPMGEVCVVPENLRCCLGQRQVLLRPKSDVCGSYLYWALQSPFVQHQISWNEGTGTTVSNVRIPVLKSLLIPRNGENESSIAECLDSLSKKSQLNHQINQTLEQMAQALFNSWFVEFEPVKAKIAARERWQALQPENGTASPVCYAAEFDESPAVGDLEAYMNRAAMQVIAGKTAAQLDALRAEDPERYHELYETAVLFPSAMQESELGEIPEGWGAGQLSSFAYLNKESWTKRTIPSEIEYIDLASVKGGIIESTTLYNSEDAPSRAKRKLSEGDTIVGTVRPGNRSFAFIKRSFVGLTGSTGFAVLSPKKEMFSEFVYIAATSDEAIGYLAHLADGGAYPAVRPEVVLNIKSVIPSSLVMDRFHQATRCYFDLSESFKDEGFTLSRTRGVLLPKLLSGEIIPVKTDK